MGKGDFLSPKAIANRQKSKGLQKLRFYCQLCQKQCRDDNGFKCHTTSEGHKRMMMVFGENPGKFIEGYSEMFEANFLEQLKISHPFSRVHANEFYQEYIRHKEHIHMNSTKWLSLSDFVKHLGRTGVCKVEETDKGWYIQLIRRDSDLLADEEIKKKKERAMMDAERRELRELAEKIERARQAMASEQVDMGGAEDATEAPEEEGEPVVQEPVTFQLKGRSGPQLNADAGTFEAEEGEDPGPSRGEGPTAGAKRKSAAVLLMEDDLRKKRERIEREKAATTTRRDEGGKAGGSGREEPWLQVGIVVKVMSRALEPHGYYKAKAEVVAIRDRFVAELEVVGSGDVLRVDQRELETVIPQIGSEVAIVKGRFKGQRATLSQVDVDNFRAKVVLDSGEKEWLEYEEFSKTAAVKKGPEK